MATTNPTARSMDWCQKRGLTVDTTERWLFRVDPKTKAVKLLVRKDVFGFGDLLAYGGGWIGATLIQSTTADNADKRIAKIMGLPAARGWMMAGNRIMVHGWRKNAANRWVCNVWLMGLQDGEIVAARVEDDVKAGVA